MAATQRKFVPADFDVADPASVEAIYHKLLDRPIASPQELDHWLLDASELAAVVEEYANRRYIDKSCHTDDPAIEKAYLHFVETIDPKIKPLFFEVQKRVLASPHREALVAGGGKKYQVLEKKWRADVELFRDENIPLQTEETKQVNEYDKICGAMTATFDGREQTLQQLGRYLEEPDRAVRQAAWEAIANRRIQDRDKIDAIFDRVIGLRDRVARNAGLHDYREYAWKMYKRFDYAPEDCHRFAAAIEEACVPVAKRLAEERARDLKLEKLRPWDTSVDPKNRPPLRPFKEDEVPTFVEKVKGIFERMSPGLASDFDSLRQRNNLDLASRKGKQPGGYQCDLPEAREPFIFMNAAGMQGDVETLLHEGGHAFHAIAARNEDLVFVRSAPIEFCEVASMSMELLGNEHLDLFYDDADAARAKRQHLEGIIRLLPWIATIDQFQHWLYTHPGHTRDARTEQWLSILDRFMTPVDWTGYEHHRAAGWQRQMHLFGAPFYYVEYGIAQLGALQLWMKSREDPQRALSNYRSALKLGGTRPLPELFSAAGIRFDFSASTLRPLMAAIAEELDSLPR